MNAIFNSLFFAMLSFVATLFVCFSVLYRRQGSPRSALTWIISSIAFPWITLIFWTIFGSTVLEKYRRHKRKGTKEALQLLGEDSKTQLKFETIGRSPNTANQLGTVPGGYYEGTDNTKVNLLLNGNEFFPMLFDAIETATDHVHLLFYHWKQDNIGHKLRDCLIEISKKNIKVRVIIDGLMNDDPTTNNFFRPLIKNGAEVFPFLHPRKLLLKGNLNLHFRNHRKLAIIDGKCAFIGGLNIGDEYSNSWRDQAVKIEGSLVDQAQAIFAIDWYHASDNSSLCSDSKYYGLYSQQDKNLEITAYRILAGGPDLDSSLILQAFFIAITQAQKRVWIWTPYLVPDSSILEALCSATARGLDVRVITQGKTDLPIVHRAGRAFYKTLAKNNIHIFEYQKSVLHTKSTLFDDNYSIIGSANFDVRSFRQNFELCCLSKDKALNERLTNAYLNDINDSEELTASDIDNWPIWKQIEYSAAHLFSPVF